MANEFTPAEQERFSNLDNIQDSGLREQLQDKFREEIRLRRERKPLKAKPAKEEKPSFATRVGFTGGEVTRSATPSAFDRAREGAGILRDFFTSNPSSSHKEEDND